jgi:protein-S-isoprenylcysteine O-methyltransferase Ste14
MAEKTLVILLPWIFLGTFIARNSIVKAETKQRIRAADPVLAAFMILTGLCFLVATFATFSGRFYQLLGAILFLRTDVVSYLGLSLFAVSIVLQWFVSAQLRESWRVGVHDNQKTELVQSGTYRFVRNPYFLSYFIMYVGLFLVRPSLVMVVLIAICFAMIHHLVLKEEAHLSAIHGKQYEEYKETTGRYLPRYVRSKRE